MLALLLTIVVWLQQTLPLLDLVINRGQSAFTFAYLVRAVTPGDYKLPAPAIEDMYKPTFRGRGAPGRVQIQAAE